MIPNKEPKNIKIIEAPSKLAISHQPKSLGKELSYETIQKLQIVAEGAYRSRMYGAANLEQAFMKMLKGHEIGIGPMYALEVIDLINGHLALRPKACLALIYGASVVDQTSFKIQDLYYSAVNDNNEIIYEKNEDGEDVPVRGDYYGCRVSGKRIGWDNLVLKEFTLEDAARIISGKKRLIDKDNYKNYPIHMCMWRAIGAMADVLIPDLQAGMLRTVDLTDDVDKNGVPLNIPSWEPPRVSASTTQPKKASKTQSPPQQGITFDMLEELFGIEQIMEVHGGMPGPQTNMAELKEKLLKSRESEEDKNEKGESKDV